MNQQDEKLRMRCYESRIHYDGKVIEAYGDVKVEHLRGNRTRYSYYTKQDKKFVTFDTNRDVTIEKVLTDEEIVKKHDEDHPDILSFVLGGVFGAVGFIYDSVASVFTSKKKEEKVQE